MDVETQLQIIKDEIISPEDIVVQMLITEEENIIRGICTSLPNLYDYCYILSESFFVGSDIFVLQCTLYYSDIIVPLMNVNGYNIRKFVSLLKEVFKYD